MTTVEFINFLEYRYSNSSFDDYYYSQYGEMRVTYALLKEFNKLTFKFFIKNVKKFF